MQFVKNQILSKTINHSNQT